MVAGGFKNRKFSRGRKGNNKITKREGLSGRRGLNIRRLATNQKKKENEKDFICGDCRHIIELLPQNLVADFQ